jgi:hypothetical protein
MANQPVRHPIHRARQPTVHEADMTAFGVQIEVDTGRQVRLGAARP